MARIWSSTCISFLLILNILTRNTTAQDAGEENIGATEDLPMNSSSNREHKDLDLDLDLSGNPLQQGCLYNYLEGWTKKRVCNSDDPPDAELLGLCRVPKVSYPEIRLFGT